MFPRLLNSELEEISNILGATDGRFTGSEISRLLEICAIPDIDSTNTKRKRLFNALADKSNATGNTDCVYAFIQEAFMPSRWLSCAGEKEKMLVSINEVLALKGIQLTDDNRFIDIDVATTVSEAKARAARLSKKLQAINAHRFVLNCCKEELLVNDYFHAVQEAAKSLTDRISTETGLTMDGTNLIERAFSQNNPAAVINTLSNPSEINEHRGIKEMLLGINYCVRNVTAHEMRINWDVDEETAVNYLSIISALHKILDKFQFIRQV